MRVVSDYCFRNAFDTSIFHCKCWLFSGEKSKDCEKSPDECVGLSLMEAK